MNNSKIKNYSFYEKKIISMLLLLSGVFTISACTNDSTDPYKNYTASGYEVKCIQIDYENDNCSFGYDRVELLSDYKSYAAYNFNFDYTESYFELNNLLVFVVTCRSSDGMEFIEILKKDNTIYPLFEVNEIGEDEPVTDDIIVMLYCVEIPKTTECEIGDKYRYR